MLNVQKCPGCGTIVEAAAEPDEYEGVARREIRIAILHFLTNTAPTVATLPPAEVASALEDSKLILEAALSYIEGHEKKAPAQVSSVLKVALARLDRVANRRPTSSPVIPIGSGRARR